MSLSAPEILENYAIYLAKMRVIESHNAYSKYKTDSSVPEEEYGKFLPSAKRVLRDSGFKTDIDAPYSRHYESYSVAMKFEDFEGFTGYIGWTYWYGGGKHGYPEEIDWIENSYFLNLLKEEEVVTVVRTFEKVENESLHCDSFSDRS